MNPAFPFVLALMMSLGPRALAAAEVPSAPLTETSAHPGSEFAIRTGTLRVPALRSLAMVAGG
jgi:hypothetical protein